MKQAIFALVILFTPLQAQEINQDELVRKFKQAWSVTDWEKSTRMKDELVNSAFEIPLEKRTRELQLVLLEELKRTTAEGHEHGSSGSELHAEYYSNLIEIVAEWQDQAVIDTLADVIHTGGVATHALASFGEHAFPAVLRKAESNDSSKVRGALFTLRLMLDQKTQLSEGSRSAITNIAARRLNCAQQQDPYILGTAAELAVFLDNPELKKRVAQLTDSNNTTELSKCGIDDEQEIKIFRYITERTTKRHN